ncbi:putative receptor-like protein kinase At3g47110 [Durio zibethinus]|uniref:non-specific serine/threonine protein kinase n=1 Tax=Durio zibethinus TaxID=66656 RepID=A0A6P6B5J4_DURZI|nr:putative receptor-like protein kinase At3g47110 [Durio zibethinus]
MKKYTQGKQILRPTLTRFATHSYTVEHYENVLKEILDGTKVVIERLEPYIDTQIKMINQLLLFQDKYETFGTHRYKRAWKQMNPERNLSYSSSSSTLSKSDDGGGLSPDDGDGDGANFGGNMDAKRPYSPLEGEFELATTMRVKVPYNSIKRKTKKHLYDIFKGSSSSVLKDITIYQNNLIFNLRMVIHIYIVITHHKCIIHLKCIKNKGHRNGDGVNLTLKVKIKNLILLVTMCHRHQRVTKLEWQSQKLAGSVSPYIGNLSFLRVLNLARNSFSNEIPQKIGRLRRLEILELSNNFINGEIPSNLSGCSKLTFVHIRGNQLIGEIPGFLGLLSNLKVLRLGYNSLTGSIPPSLGNLSSLEILSLAVNGLSGAIPEALGLANASNLVVLQVSSNQLNGNLPSFENLEKLSRFFHREKSFWKWGASDLNFLCSLTNTTKLTSLDIGKNNFGGELPECISNLSITISFSVMQDNKIWGRIPAGIGNLINLEVLVISENQLLGSIPLSIGRLQKLKVFYAHKNDFLSGAFPSSIGNLTMLIRLALNRNNLQSNIPSSLGKCQNLAALDLAYNNLTGSIPPEVIGLSSLSIGVDLSSNYLTGVLPVEVGNLKNLGNLIVSRNRLSGLLPNNLGICVILDPYLFLDGNLFEGPIPSSLRLLRGLVALDISDNNLTGAIPEFLQSFGSLEYLNLSFNDFEGMIPIEGVFKNATATFVEGNSKLCGERRKSSQQQLVQKIHFYSYHTKSILRATDGFSLQNLVGSGNFGSVYQGVLEESGVVIAVKVLNLLAHAASRSFLAEREALRNIRDRNLVKVLKAISGVDYQGNDFKELVYQFMVNGSLEDWLHPSVGMNEQETVRNLNFFQRVNVAVDVAHALEYLHHYCDTPIIHCDQKPSKILLDEEMVGHVSDFGLAKILSADTLNNSTSQSSSLGLRGTIGYAPPEYGMGSELSTKGDVYSYCILVLEMFTGKRPPTNEMFKDGVNLHNFVVAALPERVIEIIDPILLEEQVKQGHDRHFQFLNSIFEKGVICSAESPSGRMDISDVVTKLCSIRDKLHPTRLHHEGQTLYAAQSAEVKLSNKHSSWREENKEQVCPPIIGVCNLYEFLFLVDYYQIRIQNNANKLFCYTFFGWLI